MTSIHLFRGRPLLLFNLLLGLGPCGSGRHAQSIFVDAALAISEQYTYFDVGADLTSSVHVNE